MYLPPRRRCVGSRVTFANTANRLRIKTAVNENAELTDFATQYAAAWSSQDSVTFASFYAENGSLRINDGEASVRREAVEQTARSFMTSFADMVVRLVEVNRKTDSSNFIGAGQERIPARMERGTQ